MTLSSCCILVFAFSRGYFSDASCHTVTTTNSGFHKDHEFLPPQKLFKTAWIEMLSLAMTRSWRLLALNHCHVWDSGCFYKVLIDWSFRICDIACFELVATSMISVLEESKRRANEMHYVLCRICFLLDRRESKTRWNDRIQKCGEKTLNYTYFLYKNRRKWAKLRLHNRQFNAHDVKRVCKKVSNEIINVSVWCVGINIMPPGSASSDVLLKSCSKFFFFVFININDRQYYFLLFVIF